MTIDEAIRINTERVLPIHQGVSPEIVNAIKLGIEALKLIDNLRFDGSPYYPNELQVRLNELPA